MSRSSKFLKASIRLLVFLGVLRFLIVGAKDFHENGGRRLIRATKILINKGVAANMMKDSVEAANMRRWKQRVLSKFELNYSSKRRVPNGPDPIHNRRAGSSHRPPGHA